MKPGRMHRNGHGRCGGCRFLADSCAGGREARTRDGWSYTGHDVLGWVCRYCVRWVRDAERAARRPGRPATQHVTRRSSETVRGFGGKSIAEILASGALPGASAERSGDNPSGGHVPPSRWMQDAKRRKAENRARRSRRRKRTL